MSLNTHQFIGKWLMSMRFELASKCEAVNFVAAYAPTDCAKNAELKSIFWQKLEDLVEKIPTAERLFVLMDANMTDDERVL